MSTSKPALWPPEIECRAVVNIAYGNHERQVFDLYLPSNSSRASPVLLWIHGGAWCSGDRGPLAGEAGWVAAEWAVARLNYRYCDHAQHPAQVEDAGAVFKVLEARASHWNLDAAQVVAAGHSAGGHIASMLGCTMPGIAAVINQAGPTDLVALHASRETDFAGPPESNPLTRLLGVSVESDPARARSASPVGNIGNQTPPHLLVFATDDEVVPFSQAALFEAVMQTVDRPCARINLDDTGHVGPRFWTAETQQRCRQQLAAWGIGHAGVS